MNIDALIAAYQSELSGYQRRGLTERAKLVEQELRRLGLSLGSKPREDVQTEPASTITDTPETPQTPPKASKPVSVPKRPPTRKKR
jgi:hypothetical protein